MATRLSRSTSSYTAPEGRVEIAVRDHGPGIPEAARDGIFDRYYQGAMADRHRIGLGLGTLHQPPDRGVHGGQIDAEFPLDGGTRFVIRSS